MNHVVDPVENAVLASMSIIAIFILIFLACMVWVVLKFRQNRSQLLHSRDASVLMAIEKERQLIALDLHDDLSPILTATGYKITVIQAADECDMRLKDEALKHIQSVTRRIRQWADRLTPASVIQQSPFHHLSEYAREIAGNSRMKIDIYDIDFPPLSAEQSIHLHRMLQEIIHNAIKHASATQLVIYGRVRKEELVISTIDDGIGFVVNKTENSTPGTGLQNLRTRTRILKATLDIHSTTGEGTRHTIVLPLVPGT